MNEYMLEAIKEAQKGVLSNHGGPFGAVVVKDQKIISRAHNQVVASNDPTAHAEILAIRKASEALQSFDLSDCELYTSCEPCPMCLSAIFWARIPKIYYAANRQDAARAGFDDSRFYEAVCGKIELAEIKNINRSESLEVFQNWNQKNDKVRY